MSIFIKNSSFHTPANPESTIIQSSSSVTASSELKNILTFKIEPLLEQNNAGIQKLEFLIKALGDRLEYLTKKGAGEEEEEEEPQF